MTYARKTLVSLQDTPYYHVVARCVRRAWLWGFDRYAGKDYTHRKAWVLQRLTQLSSVFAIDLCAYAIMANHYHLVVHVDLARAREWTQQEVIERWSQVFARPELIERWEKGESGEDEGQLAERLIERWRARLADVSWYMRCLNEHLARRANAEDDCTGRFWEGRFKSQALLDESGLLTAMVYVDLNPVRAGIAATAADSEFTSIYERIKAMQAGRAHRTEPCAAPPLLPFRSRSLSSRGQLPVGLHSYLELVDWTTRAHRQGKRNEIEEPLPALMMRLNVDAHAWRLAMRPNGNVFGRALGSLGRLQLHARTLGQSWVRGARGAERLFGAG
jgi:REP element-mobilizing transposase RayT